METRLIYDLPAAGPWNMAVDEILLDAVSPSGPAVLRFYRWETPTLSLGYFQEHRARYRHAASVNCAWLRRSTGGGAILHDQELTYSFICPARARSGAETRRLYDAFHETLVEILAQFGVTAGLHPGSEAAAGSEPFLCFQRRSRGDVIVHRHKVMGSAQRRHRGAVLQHGSVLLASSPSAPELPGIFELTGRRLLPNDLRAVWQTRLQERLGIQFRSAGLRDEERVSAQTTVDSRFACADWNERR